MASKKGNIQAAAKRRILAIDFNDKRKLDTSRVKVQPDVEKIFMRGVPMSRREYNDPAPWGLAHHRKSIKEAVRQFNRDQSRTGRADLRRRSDD